MKPAQSYGHTTEVIVPKFVNMPKPGKSYGSVVLPDDRRYVGRPEVLGMMQKGQAYSIDTEKQDWTNGQVVIVTKAVLANGTVAASKGNGDQFKRQPTPEVDAERMYVCGLVNALAPAVYAKNGECTGATMIAMTNAARQAWRDTFGKKDEPDAS